MSARQMQAAAPTEDTNLVEALVGKWEKLLRGMPTESAAQRYRVATTALLYENEARWLRSLNEEVRSQAVGPYIKTIFPLLRRSIPNSILMEIASVQPLTGPVGAIFYYDLVYGSNKGATRKGDIFPRDFNAEYTSENVSGEILVTGDGVNYGGAGAAIGINLAYSPVRPYSSTDGFRVIIQELDATTGAVVQQASDNGDGSFTFLPTGASIAGIINYDNGAIQGFKFQTAVISGNPVKAFYSFNGELSTAIPQMNFDIKVESVKPINHRVKMVLSQESIEDLKALQGIDAEAEMIGNLSAQFQLEIDRRGINYMFQASTETTASFDRIPPSGIPELDHLRSIFTVMSTLSGIIHKKTLRRPANFGVAGPEIMALFEQFSTHNDYRGVWTNGASPLDSTITPGSAMPTEAPGQFGIFRAGLLKNRWSMYEDPFFPRDFLMLGLRGDSFMDAGFVYGPYIPIMLTPPQYNPDDNGLRRGVRSRYMMKVTRPSYFGQIRVNNL